MPISSSSTDSTRAIVRFEGTVTVDDWRTFLVGCPTPGTDFESVLVDFAATQEILVDVLEMADALKERQERLKRLAIVARQPAFRGLSMQAAAMAGLTGDRRLAWFDDEPAALQWLDHPRCG